MFNAEKLLGGLTRGSIRSSRGGLGGLMSGGAALGILGVAMEAVEHFMNKPSGGRTPPPPPGPQNMEAPPPPPPSSGRPGSSAPPPPPMTGGRASPPVPPAKSEPLGNQDAVLLIQAMIAAANADGEIDQEERNNIMERLQAVELSPEENAFISRELLSPASLETIVSRVSTPEMARQVYTVSLMAIEVDTEEERLYLETLARRLGLDKASVDAIHRSLETA